MVNYAHLNKGILSMSSNGSPNTTLDVLLDAHKQGSQYTLVAPMQPEEYPRVMSAMQWSKANDKPV